MQETHGRQRMPPVHGQESARSTNKSRSSSEFDISLVERGARMKGNNSNRARGGIVAFMLVAILLAGAIALSGCGTASMTLGTTKSLQQSGLLTQVVQGFEEQYNTKVTVVTADTAAGVLKLGATGKADVLLVNNRDGVAEFVAQKQGTNDTDVMYGDLVIVGPTSDPAQVKGLDCPAKSSKKIGTVGAAYVARGDGSDVNMKCMMYFQKAGLDPKGQPWFIVSGAGMAPTLKLASDKQAYTVTDMLTWLQNQKSLNLAVLVQGCTMLFDQYTAVVVNPAKHPNENLNTKQALQFVNYVGSSSVQKQIGGYKKYGTVLYHPNAPKTGQGTQPSTAPMKM
jgi:tungstate transport system substrate-binding protein